MDKKPTIGELNALWAKARGGDQEAVDALFDYACLSVRKTSLDSKSGIIREAMLQVLVDATDLDSSARWVDQNYKITMNLLELKRCTHDVIALRGKEVSRKAIDRFTNNREQMLIVAIEYAARYGYWNEDSALNM